MMRYRVTQRWGNFTVAQRTYRSKFWARFVAWINSGPGFDGYRYKTTIEEVD